MLKFIGSRWNNYNTLRLLHSSSTQADSLFLRISRAGDPNIPMTSILNQWIQEGKDVKHSDLQFFIKQLRTHRRFNQALQISEWMSNERNFHLLPGDIAIRLDLISKVHGLDQAEKYFNSIPHTSKDFKVYGALLNCYAQYNFVTKAESIMKHVKKRASNHAPDLVLSYNVLLKLYTRTGQHEKLVALMKEMKDKKMYDNYTLTSWLNAYASTNNIAEMEKLLAKMEVDHRTTLDWLVYSAAADGYIKACQFDKSLAMLKKSEQLIKGNSKSSAYASLLTKYAAIGKKDDVYRIWNICKILNGSRNSIYISMLMSLSQLNDIDGAETILEEWQSGNTCFDIRILNVMISVYCKNGMLEKAEAYVAKLLERDNKLDGRIWDRLACGYYKCNEMDKAVHTMKKAILASPQGWKPYPFTFAACIEHMKDKRDLELALEILGTCKEQAHFSQATCDKLISYVQGEISETNALKLMKGDYHLRNDEVLDGEKQNEML
ncbi:Tetratricopeptide repeat (TPR) superfamily protein [Trifolium repens]|nr:Tetratricopeptide repeat (TPR) superfamily protein [Trifolium repens]